VTLGFLQEQLESINGVRAPRVGRFVVSRAEARAAAGEPRAPEALIVHERDGELRLGLWLDEEVRLALRRAGPDSRPRLVARTLLAKLAAAAEGVSHFVYLATCAAAERPVSLLELEVQAEVDKFALLVLHLWRRGRRHLSPELRRRLFQPAGYRPHLGAEERERYIVANRLGGGYARWLEGRFVVRGDAEGLLRELRRTYRRGAGDKFAYLEARTFLGRPGLA
jgi:hypothetical protein